MGMTHDGLSYWQAETEGMEYSSIQLLATS